jgi:hypothetical protein
MNMGVRANPTGQRHRREARTQARGGLARKNFPTMWEGGSGELVASGKPPADRVLARGSRVLAKSRTPRYVKLSARESTRCANSLRSFATMTRIAPNRIPYPFHTLSTLAMRGFRRDDGPCRQMVCRQIGEQQWIPLPLARLSTRADMTHA